MARMLNVFRLLYACACKASLYVESLNMATGYSFDTVHTESKQMVPEQLTGFLGEPMPFSKDKHGESVLISADNSIESRGSLNTEAFRTLSILYRLMLHGA